MIYVMEIKSILWKVKPQIRNIRSWILWHPFAKDFGIWVALGNGLILLLWRWKQNRFPYIYAMIYCSILTYIVLILFWCWDNNGNLVTLTLAHTAISFIRKIYFLREYWLCNVSIIRILLCIWLSSKKPHNIGIQRSALSVCLGILLHALRR